MESSKFIRSRLVNYTNADCSDESVKNNRMHYHLRFEEAIGWEWLYAQIKKASSDLDVTLEAYKIRPSGVSDFEVEVREVERREGIDDNQSGLSKFEAE